VVEDLRKGSRLNARGLYLVKFQLEMQGTKLSLVSSIDRPGLGDSGLVSPLYIGRRVGGAPPRVKVQRFVSCEDHAPFAPKDFGY